MLSLNSTVIFIILWISQVTNSQMGPESPCPNWFKYKFDGSKWIGLIEVPNVKLGPPLTLNLTLSLRARLQTVG